MDDVLTPDELAVIERVAKRLGEVTCETCGTEVEKEPDRCFGCGAYCCEKCGGSFHCVDAEEPE